MEEYKFEPLNTAAKDGAPKQDKTTKVAAPSADPPKPRGRPVGSGKPAIKIGDDLERMFTFVGIALCALNQTDGQAIIAGSSGLAKALEHRADQDPKFKKTLEKFLQGTGWGEVVAAVAIIALPIAANHGLVPSSIAEGIAGLASAGQ